MQTSILNFGRRSTFGRASSRKCMEDCNSASGYLRWRRMQFSLNWRAMAVLKNVADMSLLATTSPEYYKSCLKKKPCFESMMEDDPLPDADVRFMTNGTTRTSPASLLFASGKTRHVVNIKQPFCVVVGVPNHVAVAIMWPLRQRRQCRVQSCVNDTNNDKNGSFEVFESVEYFDSRGFNADKRHLRRVEAFFKKTTGTARFVCANPDVDFQLADNDVCCHTWIYYFIYMRLAHHHDAKTICSAIHALRPAQRLDEVRRFQAWLLDGLQLTLDERDVANDVQGNGDDVLVKSAQQQQQQGCISTPSTQPLCKPSKQSGTAAEVAAKSREDSSQPKRKRLDQLGVAAEPDSIKKVRAFTVVNSHSYLLPQT